MTSTRVLLIRHAAHADLGRRLTGRADDAPLTDRGKWQAAALADRLGSRRLAAIYVSPRERARATAAFLCERAGTAAEVDPALDEIDFGDWTGSAFADLEDEPRWRKWNEERGTACPPHGESMAAAVSRMVGRIEGAARLHPGREVALVSHCDTIRGAIAHYLGLPLAYLLRFEVGPASCSTLDVCERGAVLTGLNERTDG